MKRWVRFGDSAVYPESQKLGRTIVALGWVYGVRFPGTVLAGTAPERDWEDLNRRETIGGVLSCRGTHHREGGSPRTADAGQRGTAGGGKPPTPALRRR